MNFLIFDQSIDYFRFFSILFLVFTFCPFTKTDESLTTQKISPKIPQQSQNRTKTRLNDASSDPTALSRRLTEGSVEVVFVNVSDSRWLASGDLGNKLSHFFVDRYVVTSRNPRVVRILNSTLVPATVTSEEHETHSDSLFPTWEEEFLEDNGVSALSVKISGHSVGRTVVDVSVYGYATDFETGAQRNDTPGLVTPSSDDDGHRHGQSPSPIMELRLVTSFDVCVLRRSVYHRLSFAFTIFVAIISVTTTFLIGTQLDWKIIIKELKKPASLLVGIGCEFFLMPLIAFATALIILRGNYGWQLACLAIGACPGGGHSPFWTMMLDGNLDLAVAMSFVASVSALGVLPFWLFTLGRVFYGGRVTIPYLTITGSLFGLVCPIFFGLAFKHYLPTWAERIGRILKPVTVVSFIVVGIFGCAVNSYVFALLDWRHFICGIIFPWLGFVLTYPLSRWIFRRNHADSVAVAVENGCLNVAVPVVLLQLSLTQPDADLSLVVPVGIVICASWPLWAYFIYLLIKKRFTVPTKPSDESMDETKKNSDQIDMSDNVSKESTPRSSDFVEARLP